MDNAVKAKYPIHPSKLDALLFDFDGVLTDNRVLVFSDGNEAVVCNRGDGLAFDRLRRSKIPVYIISSEANEVVSARAKKLQVGAVTGVEDKSDAVRSLCKQYGYRLDRLMYVGNDVNDLPAMSIVAFPLAVADAHASVVETAGCVLKTRGGEGVAREIVEELLVLDTETPQLS